MRLAVLVFLFILAVTNCIVALENSNSFYIERINDSGFPVVKDRGTSEPLINPPAGISIDVQDNSALLSWDEVSGATHYKLYTSIFPYGPYVLKAMIANNEFVYPAIDEYQMKFFTVVAYQNGEDSDPSQICGSYRFVIEANNMSLISLPFENDFVYASDLAEDIDEGNICISTWEYGWQHYIKGFPSTDFELQVGASLMVVNEEEYDVTWITHGVIFEPFSYNIAANTYTPLTVPMNRSDLTLASELATDIGEGVTSVVRWGDDSWKNMM